MFHFIRKSKIISNAVNSLMLFAVLIWFSGCKAVEAPPAGFIKNSQVMYQDPTLPFHRVWIRKDLNLNKYNKIIIQPINMNYLMEAGTLGKINFYDYDKNLEKNKKHLAKYTQEALINAFRFTPDNRFQVTYRRGFKTLTLKMAIVAFVPNKSVINGVGTGLLFVPIFSIPLTIVFGLIVLPVKAIARATTDSGFEASIAIEAVLCDSVTNRILVAFADRVSAPASIFNIKDYHYWAHIESIIQSWGVQIVRLMNRKNKKEVVKGYPTFKIQPW